MGALLGLVWSPCVGPTLGAAALLAAQRKDLVGVAAVMFAFGVGTTLPMLAVAVLSRTALQRWRQRMLSAGQFGKAAMGLSAVGVGAMILTGIDRQIETVLAGASPAWLTDLNDAVLSVAGIVPSQDRSPPRTLSPEEPSLRQLSVLSPFCRRRPVGCPRLAGSQCRKRHQRCVRTSTRVALWYAHSKMTDAAGYGKMPAANEVDDTIGKTPGSSMKQRCWIQRCSAFGPKDMRRRRSRT